MVKVEEWFKQFQLIEVPQIENKWNKKKVEKKQLELFLNKIESSLIAVEKLLKQHCNGITNSNLSKALPALFNSRMLETTETLRFPIIKHLKNLLNFYLKYTIKKQKLQSISSSTGINTIGGTLSNSNSFNNSNNNNNNNNNNNTDNNINNNAYIINDCGGGNILNGANHINNNIINEQQEKTTIQNIANDMLMYLKSHSLDPDNSLIGLQVCQNLVDLFVQNTRYRKLRAIPSNPSIQFKNDSISTSNTTTTTNSTSVNLTISNNESSTITTTSISTSSSTSATSFKKEELTVEYLLDLIQHWSKLKDIEIGEEVKGFIRSKDKFGIFQGDLVIVKTNDHKDFENQSKFIFARFSGQVKEHVNNNSNNNNTNEYLSVYINSKETDWIWVHRDDIYKFSKDMIDNCSSSRRMSQLVECPTNNLIKILSIKEEVYLREYLDKKSGSGTSGGLIEKLENQTIGFKDLKYLRSMGQCLSQLCHGGNGVLPIELSNLIQKMVSGEIGRFKSSLCDSTVIYLPTKKDLLSSLDKYPILRITQFKNRIHYLNQRCENTISKLIQQKLEILDGTTKLKLVSWWLSLIKEQVDCYLSTRGYDRNAVPHDYTITPPISMQKVASNLLVLHNVIPSAGGANNCDSSLQSLVKKLKDEIYPVINDFNSNIKYILCEWLDLNNGSGTESSSSISIQDFYHGLEKEKQHLSQDNIVKIKRMIKDVEYLSLMIKLENSISDGFIDDERRFDTEIIPISGLIYGRFFRIENELRTVLECWKDYNGSLSSSSLLSNHTGGTNIYNYQQLVISNQLLQKQQKQQQNQLNNSGNNGNIGNGGSVKSKSSSNHNNISTTSSASTSTSSSIDEGLNHHMINSGNSVATNYLLSQITPVQSRRFNIPEIVINTVITPPIQPVQYQTMDYNDKLQQQQAQQAEAEAVAVVEFIEKEKEKRTSISSSTSTSSILNDHQHNDLVNEISIILPNEDDDDCCDDENNNSGLNLLEFIQSTNKQSQQYQHQHQHHQLTTPTTTIEEDEDDEYKETNDEDESETSSLSSEEELEIEYDKPPEIIFITNNNNSSIGKGGNNTTITIENKFNLNSTITTQPINISSISSSGGDEEYYLSQSVSPYSSIRNNKKKSGGFWNIVNFMKRKSPPSSTTPSPTLSQSLPTNHSSISPNLSIGNGSFQY